MQKGGGGKLGAICARPVVLVRCHPQQDSRGAGVEMDAFQISKKAQGLPCHSPSWLSSSTEATRPLTAIRTSKLSSEKSLLPLGVYSSPA